LKGHVGKKIVLGRARKRRGSGEEAAKKRRGSGEDEAMIRRK